jgi:hypothetical protein
MRDWLNIPWLRVSVELANKSLDLLNRPPLKVSVASAA